MQITACNAIITSLCLYEWIFISNMSDEGAICIRTVCTMHDINTLCMHKSKGWERGLGDSYSVLWKIKPHLICNVKTIARNIRHNGRILSGGGDVREELALHATLTRSLVTHWPTTEQGRPLPSSTARLPPNRNILDATTVHLSLDWTN